MKRLILAATAVLGGLWGQEPTTQPDFQLEFNQQQKTFIRFNNTMNAIGVAVGRVNSSIDGSKLTVEQKQLLKQKTKQILDTNNGIKTIFNGAWDQYEKSIMISGLLQFLAISDELWKIVGLDGSINSQFVALQGMIDNLKTDINGLYVVVTVL